MGLISKLFGGSKTETVLDVEQLIADLDREETAARRTLSEVDARYSALLISGDDDKIDADAVVKSRAERSMERAALARKELAGRLDAARLRARQATVTDLKKEQASILRELREAMTAAVAANERAQAFNDKAHALLGQEAATAFPSLAYPLLNRGMLEPWERYVGQLSGPVTQPATPAAPVSKAIEKVKQKVSAPAASSKPKRDPLPAEVPTGHTRVAVLRSGFEDPSGESLAIGDLVDLPSETATVAAQNGAVDFVTEGA